MKKFWKILALFSVFALSLLMFAACDEPKQPEQSGGETQTPSGETGETQEPVYYDITFDSAGGSAVAPQTIRGGSRVFRPADPVKDGFGFVDWYYNGEPYRFRDKVESDLTLVAEWGPCEVVVSQRVDKPESWDFDSLSVSDAENAPAGDVLVRYDADEQFCFSDEGEYFVYEQGAEDPVGHYLVSDFSLSLRDFDKAGQMTYGEMTVAGQTGTYFQWLNSTYQPHLYLEDDAFETMIAYCETKNYNVIRVSIYSIQLDNMTVLFNSYFPLRTWTTRDFPVADVKALGQFDLWSQSQGTTEIYFSIEFLYDEGVEKASVFDAKYFLNAEGKQADGSAAITWGEFAVGERTGNFYKWTSSAYQPFIEMNAAFAESKAEWKAAGYNALKVTAYPILKDNSLVLGGTDANGVQTAKKYFSLNKWDVGILPLDDFEGLYLWSQSQGTTEVYFSVEPCVGFSVYFDKGVNPVENEEYNQKNQFVFHFEDRTYQPAATMSQDGVAAMKEFAEENGYNTLRVLVLDTDVPLNAVFNENQNAYNSDGTSGWGVDKTIALSELDTFRMWSWSESGVAADFVLEFLTVA